MSLFQVPGWSVPAAPVSQASKKRKRPVAKDTDDVDEAERMQTAQKNIEKLMRSLGAGTDALEGEDAGQSKKKKRGEKKEEEKGKVADERGKKEAERGRKAQQGRKEEATQGKSQEHRRKKGKDVQASTTADRSPAGADPSPKKSKKQKNKKRAESVDARSDAGSTHGGAPSTPAIAATGVQVLAKKTTSKTEDKDEQQGLTALQANMKKSLDGARFRWINETLYKFDSANARELMSKDPGVFADYHTGFRLQVESWPTNPVSHYISALSSYPAKTVIADLGCGDAALARALVPKGLSVLSFDLVSDGAYVVEADTCVRVPLPGSERLSDSGDGSEDEGEAQIVDVVVCALSLMGTNWPGCIREAWRILRSGGELKIAEVTSRLANVDEFTTFISSFGFKLTAKDERNTHFALFEFRKAPRKPKYQKDWKKCLSRGAILKPCEYKRR